MVNYVGTPPADPVAGQPGHLAYSQWTKDSILALDAVLPVGFGGFWYSDVAPDGWAICDGSPHGSVALEALLGSPNTPDLRDMFPRGKGATSAIGDTGGAATVTLTAAQSGSPAHGHTASGSSGSTGAHTHSVSGSSNTAGSHIHSGSYTANFRASEGPRNETPNEDFYEIGQTAATLDNTEPYSGSHSHTVTGTAASGGSHSHTVSVSVNNSAAANAAEAHENLPPYKVVNWIIKK